MIRYVLAATFLLTTTTATTVHADDDGPVEVGAVTGRPGIGDANLVVPKGSVLFTPGLTVYGPVLRRGGPVLADTNLDLLMRVGVADGIELAGDAQLDSTGSTQLLSSLSMGFQLLREDDAVPGLRALATVYLPVAADTTTTALEGRLAIGKGFGVVGISGNAIVSADARSVDLAATLCASVTAPPGLTPFVELFADDVVAPVPLPANLGIDAGAGYQINRNVAVDLSGGVTFLGEQSVFISAGVSLLWP